MRTLHQLAAPVAFLFAASALVGCANEELEMIDDEDASEVDGEDGDVKKSGTSSDSSSDDADEKDEKKGGEEEAESSGSVDPEAPPPPPAPPAPPADPNAPPSSACLADSVAEAEANDTAADANAIPGATGTFCGTISADADVDFVSFTAPATFAGLSFKLSSSQAGANVQIVVDDGAPVTLGQGAVPAVKGGKYVIRVAGTAGLAYRLGVTFR